MSAHTPPPTGRHGTSEGKSQLPFMERLLHKKHYARLQGCKWGKTSVILPETAFVLQPFQIQKPTFTGHPMVKCKVWLARELSHA